MTNEAAGSSKFLEDLVVRRRIRTGTFAVTPELVRAFAESYDPQPATRRSRSAATGPRRNCATWSAPASRRRAQEGARQGRLREGEDRRLLGLHAGQMPHDGGGHRALGRYATADIVAYDGVPLVKLGRE